MTFESWIAENTVLFILIVAGLVIGGYLIRRYVIK